MRYSAVSLVILVATSLAHAAGTGQRQILICASEHAPPEIKQLADDLARNAAHVPVLKGLIDTQGAGPVVRMSSEELLDPKEYDRAALNHLVVIGLSDTDPLMAKVWEHYAAIDPKQKTIYAQGWGELKGDIGYIESDRNPFLHSRRIKTAPFETVIFKISGTSPAGVAAAATAFNAGLLNGLVPAGKFERPRATILDLDPVVAPPILQLPASLAMNTQSAAAPLVGWSQAPANEYRAYIDAAGFEPVRVWRCKYLEPHALDQAGVKGWMAGFHRMAYGNAVTLAEFKTADEASQTAAKIGARSGWKTITPISGNAAWQADQPTDENMPQSLGKVTALARGKVVIFSSLPPEATIALIKGSN